MQFLWDDEKIEWYIRASNASGFHKRLAERVIPVLKKTDHVVDFGCGPGIIDLEIASHVGSITAIDINEIVLHRFRSEIEKRGFSNIFTVLGDIEKNRDTILSVSFDVAIFCFFGGPGYSFDEALNRASRLVILITHGVDVSKKSSKIVSGMHRTFADEVDAYLASNRVQYLKISECIDFYQPFLSLGEAERFFNSYAKEGEASSKERRTQVERQLELVEKTDDPAYPWRFPNLKDTAIYIIEK